MARPTATKQLFKPPTDEKRPAGAKKRKWRAGTVAKREIRYQQRSTAPLVNKAAIRKAVLSAAADLGKQDIRFKKTAVAALREAASTFLVDFFASGNKVRATEGKSVTLQRYHTQIGRTTMGVDCVSEVAIPMMLPIAKVDVGEKSE